MVMSPQEQQAFKTLQDQVQKISDDLREAKRLAEEAQKASSKPLTEGDLPPHFHKVDRISFPNIKGGPILLSATPTEVAEEGTARLYTTGGNTYLAYKVNQAWKSVLLS